MKIAVFGHKHMDSREGGVEVVVSALYPHLTDNNVIDIYDRREIDKSRWEYKEHDNNIRIFGSPTISNGKLNAIIAAMFSSMRIALKQYDVVHVHAEGSCVFIPLLKLMGKKVVVTIHGLDWQRNKWGGFASYMILLGEKMAGRYADAIIVLNDETKSYFRDRYGRRAFTIINGVEEEPVDTTGEIERIGLSKGSYYLYLGRFAPEKRIDLLVDAYLAMDTDRKLVLAGPDKDLDTNAEWYKKAKEHPDRIIFTGFVDGLLRRELSSFCQAFILPSDLEGMSISLLEGLGYGVNVIASDIEENTIVLNGFGRTFKKGDADDLRKRLEEVDALPFKRHQDQMDYIQKEHGWKGVAEQTEELLRDVACGNINANNTIVFLPE